MELRVISSADQAAEALRPLAGKFAFLLFAIGIIGTGLLAVPVLAGSAAYAVSETFQWTASLEKKPTRAVKFYLTIGCATLVGLLLNFMHLNPIRALFSVGGIEWGGKHSCYGIDDAASAKSQCDGAIQTPTLFMYHWMGRDRRNVRGFRRYVCNSAFVRSS